MLRFYSFISPFPAALSAGAASAAFAAVSSALGAAFEAFLALFGNKALDLALQLTQLAHLRAELDGAADGENRIGEIDAADERGERHDHDIPEGKDM